MMGGLKSRYAAYQYVFVGADFHTEGGAWRSIHAFYKHLNEAAEPVLLVDLRRGDGWKQWICSLVFAPRIVVNGMAAVERWRILLGLALRKDAAVYLHDTDYMLDVLQRDKPLVYRCLTRLLKNRPMLCVSERMAATYRERFGSRNTVVIYEMTELQPEPILDPKKVHIVMVGSLNRRKGYPLFVKTAELAEEQGLSWQFHWVGGLGESDLSPVSGRIIWWGWRYSAAPIVKLSDVFFLSSVDDPQPLACLEALALGKRAVVYKDTGSAEVINGLSGCRIFLNYGPESAVEALKSALQESVAINEVQDRLLDRVGVRSFEQRLKNSFFL